MMLTILAGVSVFVIGQFLLKLLVEPIVSLKKSIGELSALFLQNHAVITNAHATITTQQDLKRVTSNILSNKQAVPFYSCFAVLLRLPSEECLIDACRSVNLIAHNIAENVSEESRFSRCVEISDEMKNISQKMKILVDYKA